MRTLVVGVGSTILGDDGVGVRAARRLDLEGVDVEEIGTGGLALLDLAAGYDRLILLDAIVSGAPPGTVHVLEGEAVARTVHLGTGHDADLPAALAFGRAVMGEAMPREVHVVAVEAARLTEFSEELTPEVEAAIPAALSAVSRLCSGSP